MAGLPSLMNQSGQTPGQAPLPGQDPMQQGMASQQGAQTPGGVTGQLSQLPAQQLLSMYNNPQDMTPKWAVASAYAKAVEQQRQMQMAQGQSAMAQNSQQQLPVAQEIMSQSVPQETQETQDTQEPSPVMAAYGGMMRGYAGGGAVAFNRGGNVQYFSNGANEFGLMANPEAEAMDALRVERAQKEKQLKALEDTYYALMMQQDPRAAQVKQQLDALTGRATTPTAPVATSRLTPQALEGYVKTLAASPAAAPAPSMPMPSPGAPRRQPMAGQAVAEPAAQPALAPQAALSPEMEEYYKNRASDLRTRQGLPEEILAGRAGLEALARESIAAQRGESEAFGREARERRDAALARPQMDARALFDIAGSIDTRKGQAVGSLSRGISNLLGQREAAAEAARKEYATAQQTERMLQANVRQATMLEAQRAQALRENDFNRANQIKDQIDALMMQRETLLMERKDKAIEQARQERLAKATEMQAQATARSASRPNELEIAMSRPEEYKRILAARAEAQQLKKSPEQVRADALERYADNWEKLDMMQKNELAKQGVTNFQQYVRMRDQMAGLAGTSTGASNDPLGIRK